MQQVSLYFLFQRIVEFTTVLKQLEEVGDRVSSEKRKSKPNLEDDPYGGVFLGFGPPPDQAKREEVLLTSPQTPFVEEATEKTSLLP